MRYIVSGLFIAFVGALLWYGYLYWQNRVLVAATANFPDKYSLGYEATPPVRLVALGDSTTVGQGVFKLEDTFVWQVANTLSNQGNYVHVQNYGVIGATAEDVLESQINLIKNNPPDILLVSIGGNDAIRLTSAKKYTEYMEKLLDELAALNETEVYIANTPDLTGVIALKPFHSVLNLRADNQNKILNIVAAKYPHLTIVDIFANAKPDSRSKLAADLFHPSAEGYKNWVQAFREKVVD